MHDSWHIHVLCGLDGQEDNAIVVYTPIALASHRPRGNHFVAQWQIQMNIAMSPIHLEYTMVMQGVDVVD